MTEPDWPQCAASLRHYEGGLEPQSRCGEPAFRIAADILLCDRHYRRALEWAEKAARWANSIVYYVQRGDGLIKIGTSRGATERLAALARGHGPLTLLATHEGSRAEEAAMHREFRALRVEGEWFRPELALLLHIKKVHIATGNLQPEWLPARINRLQLNKMIREARAQQTEGAA